MFLSEALGLSPVNARQFKRSKKDAHEVFAGTVKKIRKSLEEEFNIQIESPKTKEEELEDMLQGLKQAFKDNVGNSDAQYRILTSLPPSWSVRKIMKEFEVGQKKAKKAKELQKKNGFHSFPSKQVGKSLSSDTVNTVRDFYNTDNISRLLPGKKDCVSMKVNGEKQRVQKRLILCLLKEAYIFFKDKYQDNMKIGFSKFSELRPKNVVLPNASGTHSVCVCTYHQNFKLMLENSGLSKNNPFNFEGEITYKNYISLLMCNPPTQDCYLNECNECESKDLSEYKDVLVDHFEDVDEIKFNQWESTDRCNLSTKIAPTVEFIDQMFQQMQVLKPHSFIAQEQSKFLNSCKLSLKPEEVIIGGDFAENYSFIAQVKRCIFLIKQFCG